MHEIGSEDLRLNIGDTLNRVKYEKRRYVVTKHGQPWAMLVPVDDEGEDKGQGRGQEKKEDSGGLPYEDKIPDHLRTDSFREAWREFCAYRRQDCRKKVTERAATIIMNKLEGLGEDQAIGAFELSIQNDWQGVFPSKMSKRGDRKKSIHHRTHDSSIFDGEIDDSTVPP